MKRILVVTLLSFSAFCLKAQEINATFKKASTFKDDYTKTKILAIGDDGNGGVIMARKYSSLMETDFGYCVEYYNDKLVKVKSYQAEGEEDINLNGAIIDGTTVSYIEYTYDKKQKAFVVYANQANVKDMKFSKKAIISIPLSRDKKSKMNMLTNTAKDAFLITVDINTGAGKEKEEMHKVYVINKKLDILIETTLDKDFDKGEYEVMSMEVSPDNSSAYLVGKTKIEKPAKNTPDYFYDLTKITNGNSKTAQTFKAGGHHVSQIRVATAKEKVVCVGIYSDEEEEWQKGLCYFAIEPSTLSITTSKQLPFTEDMLKLYNDKKLKDKLRVFEGKDLFVTTNNDFIYTAEQFRQVFKGAGKDLKMYYNYGNILSAKINNEGELAWITTIEKYQFGNSVDNTYFSYIPMLKDDSLYIFVNGKVEKKDNFYVEGPTVPFGGLDFNVFRLDKNGTAEFKEILDTNKERTRILTTVGGILPGGSPVYFLGAIGKDKQAVKINL